MMATNSANGSILYKILIVVLVVVLIFIILIPAEIWEQENLERTSAQYNMTSIYEAEKFYHRKTNQYTTDKDKLLKIIREDSTLKQVQQLVNYTQALKNKLDAYLNIPYLKNLLIIDQNIATISEDLVKNERWFKSSEEILSKAENLGLRLLSLNNELNYPNYTETVNILDTLYQLRRDLSDYNLQTAASKCADLSGRLNTYLPGTEFEDFKTEWDELFSELTSFRKEVDQTGISKQTSVAARIREFGGKVDKSVQGITKIDRAANIKTVESSSQAFTELYSTFLQDFLITGRRALYKLAIEDSMVLYISDENFLSSGNGQPYILGLFSDSSDIKVESPMLVDELLEKVRPLAENISTFEFIPHYVAYLDSLRSIHKKGMDIKKRIRRNIDITVMNKEIEEKVDKYYNGSEYNAANDLTTFVDLVGSSRSYSDLKNGLENARNAISIFDQIYSGNLFTNIDSINSDILGDLEEYNSILTGIRRLPKDVQIFENEPGQLNQIVSNMKQQTTSTKTENLKELQSQLEEVLLFATKGKSVRIYGIFEKSQQNYGYVDRTVKSWEEEE